MTETPSSGSCRLQDASSVLLSSSNPALSLLPSTAEDCYQTLPSPYPLFTLSHILLLIIIIHCRHFSKSDFRSSIHTNPLPIHSLAAQQAAQAAQKPSSTTPSGIAQLRQASQSNSAAPASASADFMNLDEFIVPSSIGSPAGIESLHATSDHNVSQAPLVPASLPHPPQELRRNDEFGYVQRRVRKTSVDDRKVSLSRTAQRRRC